MNAEAALAGQLVIEPALEHRSRWCSPPLPQQTPWSIAHLYLAHGLAGHPPAITAPHVMLFGIKVGHLVVADIDKIIFREDTALAGKLVMR